MVGTTGTQAQLERNKAKGREGWLGEQFQQPWEAARLEPSLLGPGSWLCKCCRAHFGGMSFCNHTHFRLNLIRHPSVPHNLALAAGPREIPTPLSFLSLFQFHDSKPSLVASKHLTLNVAALSCLAAPQLGLAPDRCGSLLHRIPNPPAWLKNNSLITSPREAPS